MNLRGRHLFALLTVLASACADQLAPINANVPSCAQTDQCEAGLVCHLGYCLEPTVPRCGDGNRREDVAPGETGFEACDDGNASDHDGCTTLCQFAVCGDGHRRADIAAGQPGHEECDDGNPSNTDDCTSGCHLGRCGDGILRTGVAPGDEGYEECDDDNSDASDDCTDRCALARCGDGIVRAGLESCDDANQNNQDGCTNACTIAVCGDGIARTDRSAGQAGAEECDDGNREDRDDCNNHCVGTFCGDGLVQRNERCDDGNDVENDGCSSACGVGPTQLVSSDRSHCVRTEDGRVYCWGSNSHGELGTDDHFRRSWATLVSGLSGVVDLAAGTNHFCAVNQGGQVLCWGREVWSELGRGPNNNPWVPGPVLGLENARAVVAGYYFSCALKTNATVVCWGIGSNGRLGDGASENHYLPVAVTGLGTVVAIDAGGYHSCAIDRAGALFCWGLNNRGQLGVGDRIDRASPALVTGLPPVAKVFANYLQTCAISRAGNAYCWGHLNHDPARPRRERLRPTLVTELEGARSFVGSGEYGLNCAVVANGRVHCWNYRNEITRRLFIDNARQISVGINSLCSLDSSYAIRCAGLGSRMPWWSEGHGEPRSHVIATRLAHIASARRVVSNGLTSCTIGRDESLRCWGYDGFGVVGNGSGRRGGLIPGQILPGVIDAGLGGRFGCALLGDARVQCWGANDGGRLGTGSLTPSSALAPVQSALENVAQLTVGNDHSCVRLPDGTLRCWGYNTHSGIGGCCASEGVPRRIEFADGRPLDGVIDVDAGVQTTCALRQDGRLWCWGWNYFGLLGRPYEDAQDAISESAHPLQLPRLSEVRSFAIGYHGCALLESGQVTCWGGRMATVRGGSASLDFIPIRGLREVTQVCVGNATSCALLADGTVRCWGDRVLGQANESRGSAEPLQVPGLTDIVDINCGLGNVCATDANGAVSCWGYTPLPKPEGWRPHETVRGINEEFP